MSQTGEETETSERSDAETVDDADGEDTGGGPVVDEVLESAANNAADALNGMSFESAQDTGHPVEQPSGDAGEKVNNPPPSVPLRLSAEEKEAKRKLKNRAKRLRYKAKKKSAKAKVGVAGGNGEMASANPSLPPAHFPSPLLASGPKSGVKAAVSKKRPLQSPGLTSSPKRKKTYQEAAQTALQLVVYRRDDMSTPLTADQGQSVRAAIQSLVLEYIRQNPQNAPLLFERSGWVDGWYLVTAADQHSFDWLRIAVEQIDIGIQLAASARDEMPGRIRLGIHVPGTTLSVAEILEVLSGQNPGLDTSRWVEIHPSNGIPSSDRMFLVDPASADYARAKGFLLYFGDSKIRCWLAGGLSKIPKSGGSKSGDGQ